jgi:hypothetical protein
MTEFFSGDIVRVEMPRGYSVRGVLGVSLMFTTSAEAKFEGAIGTITEINPVGPQSVHQYLVDFRTHDNSRLGIPWQAQWFREEWLGLVERPALVASAAKPTPEATWPEKPAAPLTVGGIAHPEANLFKDGLKDFAPPGFDASSGSDSIAHPGANLFDEGASDFAPPGFEARSAGTVPTDALGFAGNQESAGFTGADRDDDRSGSDVATFEPTMSSASGIVDATTPGSTGESLVIERGEGFVKVSGMSVCPDGFPIKGNANSGIFHAPSDSSYQRTIPEICFASEEVAIENGYRAPGRRG